ncbi:hypothetical protein AAG906_004516 [Vitis piasezkii]
MVSIPLANRKDRFSIFILCMVTLSSLSSTTNADSPCFDVMNYGALGDGKTDDSQVIIPFSLWLALTGNGTTDGQGAGSWEEKNTRVTALKFNYCEDLELEGLTHINPQKSHISLHNCDGANVSNITTSAPEDSPNTDGIDISCSNHVQIQDANIGTGDDCIAINSKCSFINITNFTCGLGHGISIGSLGDPTEGTFDTVSKVYVQSCNFTRQNTTGVRIKTWQVVIDQFYCPEGACKHNNNTNTSALAISKVSYTRLSGTSSRDEVVSLLCASDVQPSADKCLSS